MTDPTPPLDLTRLDALKGKPLDAPVHLEPPSGIFAVTVMREAREYRGPHFVVGR